MAEATFDFQIRRDDLRQHRLVPQAMPGKLESGQVLLHVDRFALTANNITYAAFGEAMSYWKFFPAPGPWGHMPVWGFAQVARSAHPQIPVGERVYGFLPTASWLTVDAGNVQTASFTDTAAHRKGLPSVYNSYARTPADPSYRFAFEDQQMLLRPLYVTSFLIDDFLADNGFFGARQVVVSSASSKTAASLAFLLRTNHHNDCRLVGLTSPDNLRFVQGLDYYDEVVDYSRIGTMSPGVPTVYVDFSGSKTTLSTMHQHFQDDMRYSCRVGGTHWDELAGRLDLPGAQPAFFFAPTQIRKRIDEWGAEGFGARVAQAWNRFVDASASWLRIEHHRGAEALIRLYDNVLAGRTHPAEGHIVVMAGR